MLRYLVVAAISFGSLVFGGSCSAKDLEPFEPTKARKVKLPITGKTVKLPGAAPAAEYKLFGPDGTSYHPLAPEDLVAGQAGALARDNAIAEFKVISVADGSNLLVVYDESTWAESMDHRSSSTTHRYINFWLKGFSTKGIVDGDQVTIPWVVDVTGTKKYTTAAGAQRTVLLIEPHQETDKERKAEEEERKAEEDAAQELWQAKKDAVQKERQAKENAAQKRQNEKQAELDRKAAAEKALWRLWTDASGNKRFAKFGYVIAGTVKLIQQDGTAIKMPLTTLSDEDRQWLVDHGKIPERSNRAAGPTKSTGAAVKPESHAPASEASEEGKDHTVPSDGEAKAVEEKDAPAHVVK